MKKLIATIAVVLALNVNAQETKKAQKVENRTEQEMKKYDDLNLSATQKKQVKKLIEEKNASKSNTSNKDKSNAKTANQSFDEKMEKVLTKEQYAKYKKTNASKKQANQSKKQASTTTHK